MKNTPFEARRSMRPIENRIIQAAEMAHISDISEYIDHLTTETQDQLARKDAQYVAMQQSAESAEQENEKLHSFIKAKGLEAEYLAGI
jgi:hypothetical protein